MEDKEILTPETEYGKTKPVKEAKVSKVTPKKKAAAKGQSDLDDALSMLSSMFYLILKVNLTEDTFKDIALFDALKDVVSTTTSFTSLTEAIGESGDVSMDDIEIYADFTNLENLRESFWKGNNYISCKFHQRVDDEYRWVLMEMIKSCEYTADNQVVVLYLRDVHDEYMRQKDEFAHLSNSAVKTTIMNLTANLVEYTYGSLSKRSGRLNISIDNYLSLVCANIPLEEEAIEFKKQFSLENLLEKYRDGIKTFSYEHTYRDEIGEIRVLRSTIVMSEDSVNQNIVANLFAFDITNQYVNSALPKLFFSDTNWNISIINTQSSEITFLNLASNASDERIPATDYDSCMDFVSENHVVPAERDLFRKRCSIENIQKMLSTKEVCEFTTNVIGEDGNPHLLKSKYKYFHKELGFILHIIEDVTSLSEQDMLTGECNRQGFVRRAGEILNNPEDKNEYAILYMDIKRFKAINELFGTEVGDNILRTIPELTSKSFLNPVLTARHTADRFVFLVNRRNLDLKELTNLCTFKYDAAGKSIMIYIHCGIYYIEDKTMDIDAMCNRATIAERYIDNEHVRPYSIFEAKMSESYVDRSALYNALPDALANEEFKPYYQPIFDSKTGEVVSAEALVRWFHPQWGFMNPGLFVPALEEGGYISSVDLMIATHVQKFLEDRESQGKPIVPVSINLSRMDFYDSEMMRVLKERVSGTSLAQGFHRFEVTESSYMDITETDVSLLDTLRSLGAQILIDDFGSGYSSFGTIADYDFDIIKLDMAFIKKIGKNAKIESIIHSLIDMAHHMKAKVIAEGAETEEQVNFLREHDCDYIQGFYFSRPLPEEEFVKLLDTSKIKK